MKIFVLFHILIVVVDDAKQMNVDYHHVLDVDQLHFGLKLRKKHDFQ